MELIPIIKLALMVFTGVVTVIIAISYIIYKYKGTKSMAKPALAAVPVRIDNRRVNENIYKNESVSAYSEQQNLIHYRNNQKRKLTLKMKPKKERFVVVNPVVNVEEEVTPNPRVFYRPQVNAKILDITSNENLFDRYSASSERLNKLYVG